MWMKTGFGCDHDPLLPFPRPHGLDPVRVVPLARGVFVRLVALDFALFVVLLLVVGFIILRVTQE